MRRRISFFCLLGLFALAAASPARVRAGALEGLRLVGGVLVPALLPMSVLANLLLLTGLADAAGRRAEKPMRRLFRLPGQAAAPLLLGLLGGYPLGPLVLAGQLSRGALQSGQARRLAVFCNNPGPAFLLGAVGLGVLQSSRAGLALLACSAASALLTGLLLARFSGDGQPEVPRGAAGYEKGASGAAIDEKGARARAGVPLSPGRALGAALERSAGAMLRLSVTVVFFSALRAAAEPLLPLRSLPDWAAALAAGSLELSGGVLRLAGCAKRTAFVLAAFLSGFGGLCVQLQSLEALSDAGFGLRRALGGGLCKGLICALLAALCVRLGLAGL